MKKVMLSSSERYIDSKDLQSYAVGNNFSLSMRMSPKKIFPRKSSKKCRSTSSRQPVVSRGLLVNNMGTLSLESTSAWLEPQEGCEKVNRVHRVIMETRRKRPKRS